MEQFNIPKPTLTGRKLDNFQAYRNVAGLDLKWSAPFPLPEVGSRVYIILNGIGWAVVTGYFECDGFLGVMTKATNPPKWLRDQRRRDIKSGRKQPDWVLEGIGCEYGAEILLHNPKLKRKQVAA